MRCEYCDVEVTEYPSSGICVCCGGKLPPKPIPTPAQPVQPVQTVVQPVYIPVQQMPYHATASCPKCGSSQIARTQRGFRWGLGILGFFLIPVFGIFLGFCGSKKPMLKCTACGRKWKPG